MDTIQKLIKKAENLGWNVTVNHEDGTLTLQRWSPAGQDFDIEIGFVDDEGCESVNTAIANLKAEISSYDVSEQTNLWLDNTGHGKNGAPDDMLDVYADILDCSTQMNNLYEEWIGIKPPVPSVLDKLQTCLDTLNEIKGSGYIPFASPSPCSNEIRIKVCIEASIENLEKAIEHHKKQL